MERQMMISDMERCLVDEGYRVSCGSGCFDLLARKDVSIALKVLANVDSFTHSEADDMKALSCFLGTFPFLVGGRATRYELEESVVYERFGVAAMSPRTFTMFVNGVMPSLKCRRGGFTVRVDGEMLERGMNEAGISMAELSSATGLSMKTLYKCSKGGTVDTGTCEEIEKVIGFSISGGVDMGRVHDAFNRDPRSGFKKALSGHLDRMGLMFSFLSRSPFNLVIKERGAMVSVASRNKKRLAANADMLRELETQFGLNPLFITSDRNMKCMDGIPVISLREVKGMETGDEFLEKVEERRD